MRNRNTDYHVAWLDINPFADKTSRRRSRRPSTRRA